MSGQKRSLPRPQRPSVAQSVAAGDPPSPAAQPQEQHDEDEEGLEEMAEGEEKTPTNPPQQQDGAGGDGASLSPSFLPLFPFDLMPWRRRLFHCTGCDGEGDGSQSEDDLTDEEQFVPVRLPDIRKEVQCAICLGIIRKTRTVMECLHRFCRACIDKSMRLGNNECPACRTHCASRRSLRDDSNYDTIIATLYPDIDKYEEEELAFHEEEMSCNKKLQASMAEIFQRQTESLGRRRSTAKATAAAFVRRSQGNYRNHVSGRGGNGGRDTMAVFDDDDEEEANVNDVGKSYSSADEPSPDRRQKRRKRWGALQFSPARTAVNVDAGVGDNDDFEFHRENNGALPLRVGNREAFAWGKNGARSQTRHGNTSGTNGRKVKCRMTKLVDYLRNLDHTVDEFDVHLTLVPLDKERVPSLQQPYLCCQPSLSIRHLCEYIALQTSVPAEEVQIYAKMLQGGASAIKSLSSTDMANEDPLVGLQELEGQESVTTLNSSFTGNQGELVLVYHLRKQA
ncbi:putative E3 ubiquitin-protein ligase RING1b isoform X1 [Musa acuminata AAA Group]|uniref:putative E3 ubiquitin-protein ligase RING1b isoform X1 n=1 Tax=Musa acuminata AAA Group TaxID=214697 RepID=UPI0031D85AAE